MPQNERRSIGLLTAVFLLGSACLIAVAQENELWVVNGGSRDITIVNTATEKVLQQIPLPGGVAAPAPRDICASRMGVSPAAYAFVTQGPKLHVVSTASRSVVRTIDFALLIGRRVRLEGCDAASAAEFSSPSGTALRHHLFLSARAEVIGTSDDEPWFFVVDQQQLVPGASGEPIVGEGPLSLPSIPSAARGIPYDVAAVAAPWGPRQHQRAWFTVQRSGNANELDGVLIAKGQNLNDRWEVVRRVSSPVPAGLSLGAARIGTPDDRNLPVFPEPATGRLLNVDTGGRCDVGGRPSYLSIAGPAQGALQIWSLDRGARRLIRTNESSCDTQSFALGRDPISISHDDNGPFGATFVVNRGDDSVTIIRPDSSVGMLQLGPPPAGNCLLCPEASIPISGPRATCCTITNLTVTTLDVNGDSFSDDRLTWTAVGSCPNLRVWCRCTGDSAFDGDCPCYCAPGDTSCVQSPPPPMSISSPGNLYRMPPLPWKPLGYTPSAPFDNLSAGAYDLEYTVTP